MLSTRKPFHVAQECHKPPIDTIKFGKFGPNKDKYVYSYSRHAFVTRKYWFKQIGPEMLLNAVKDWISQKKQEAKEDDVVNIMFECHGHRDYGLKIGSHSLHWNVFRGVQVNVIIDACHSGPLVGVMKYSTEEHRYAVAASEKEAWTFTRNVSNRTRNSRFTQAFVQSLTRLNLPGKPRRKVTWKLSDHENLIRDMTMRNLTPGAKIITPRFHASSPLTGMSAVEDMIFRKKVDVLFDPRDISHRNRARETRYHEYLNQNTAIQHYARRKGCSASMLSSRTWYSDVKWTFNLICELRPIDAG